jgi:dTMP kinase
MFITLEGPEGSGKTSQMLPLITHLQEAGYEAIATREPGGTLIGDQIRQVLHDLKNTAMHPHTETLLYQASRAQLVERLIRPALEEGKIVVCDRYADSTLAYQGYGHEQDIEGLRAIIHYATGGLKPNLTLLLDLDVEEGLRRRSEDAANWNRLDAYGLEFHRRVRAGYHTLVAQEPERWVVIDASQPLQDVQTAIREAVMSRVAVQE